MTGTIGADMQAVTWGYAAFARSGGGKCPAEFRLVLVENADALGNALEGLPDVDGVGSLVEILIEVTHGDPVEAGEYTSNVRVVFDGAEVSGQGTVVVSETTDEEQGALLEGTVDIAIADPPVQLSGPFAATVCTPLGYGVCGA